MLCVAEGCAVPPNDFQPGRWTCDFGDGELNRVERMQTMIGHLQFCLECGWCVLGMLIDWLIDWLQWNK